MSDGETRATPLPRAGPVTDTLKALGSDRERGLTAAEAGRGTWSLVQDSRPERLIETISA